MKINCEKELEGAIKAFVHIYSENVNALDPEKHLHFVVTDYGTKQKVSFRWTNEPSNDKAAWLDDHFYLLKSEGLRQLEKYVNDLMDEVTKDAVTIYSNALTGEI